MSGASVVGPVGAPAASLDTPALLLDLSRVRANIDWAAGLAEDHGFSLRPHVKTHKLPPIAHMQIERGAVGISVAKVGEAEVMSAAGITDIFVANQVVGEAKLRRLLALSRRIRLASGVDHADHVDMLSQTFAGEPEPFDVLIEIDVGQGRTGVAPDSEAALDLARRVSSAKGLRLRGIYTHEGHDYAVPDAEELAAVALRAQEDMLATATSIESELGTECLVSIGSTPSLINGEFLEGIHECRPGTYVFSDASMANVWGDTDRCAATVLATVVNVVGDDRIVVDAGAKALTSDRRAAGTILHNRGFGLVKGVPNATVVSLSDEHGVIDVDGGHGYAIGDKLEIIPNHICPAVNLYDLAYGIRNGRVEAAWPVAARGKTQ